MKNVTKVRAFTEMAGKYRKNLSRFSNIACPMHASTYKGRPLTLNERQQQAFTKLKRCLINEHVLAAEKQEGTSVLDKHAVGQASKALLQQ